jgi:hypothetical protein
MLLVRILDDEMKINLDELSERLIRTGPLKSQAAGESTGSSPRALKWSLGWSLYPRHFGLNLRAGLVPGQCSSPEAELDIFGPHLRHIRKTVFFFHSVAHPKTEATLILL